MRMCFTRRFRRAAGLACALLLLPRLVGAALVNLNVYVTYQLLLNDSPTLLADERWIVIVGSGDANNDGMTSYGDGLVSYSTQGDDVILGYALVGQNEIGNTGRFFRNVQYDPSQVGYVYIRFFDTANLPAGNMYWGHSGMAAISGPDWGVSEADVAPLTDLVATNHSSFYVVPEPGTGALILVVLGLFFGARRLPWAASRKRRNR